VATCHADYYAHPVAASLQFSTRAGLGRPTQRCHGSTGIRCELDGCWPINKSGSEGRPGALRRQGGETGAGANGSCASRLTRGSARMTSTSSIGLARAVRRCRALDRPLGGRQQLHSDHGAGWSGQRSRQRAVDQRSSPPAPTRSYGVRHLVLVRSIAGARLPPLSNGPDGGRPSVICSERTERTGPARRRDHPTRGPLGSARVNPFNGELTRSWIADYVLASYVATGAVMGWFRGPDQRDFVFARQVTKLARSKGCRDRCLRVPRRGYDGGAWTAGGRLVHSGPLDWPEASEGPHRGIVALAEGEGLGAGGAR